MLRKLRTVTVHAVLVFFFIFSPESRVVLPVSADLISGAWPEICLPSDLEHIKLKVNIKHHRYA